MKNLKHSMTILFASLTLAAAVCYTSHRSGRRVGITKVECRDKVMIFGRSNGDCVSNAHSTPVGVSGFHGGSEMICKHAIVSCVIRKGMCDCADCMESCKLSKFDALQYPTFKQCMEIYQHHSNCERRTISVTMSRVKKALARLNMDAGTCVNELTYRRAEELVALTENEGLSKSTIIGTLNAFNAITSKRFRKWFDEIGVERFIFDFPDVVEERHDVVTMTESQVVDVDQLIYCLRSSNDCWDREMFKALFFERHLAMRPSDINRLKWGNLENEFGKIVLRYIPHKTEKKTHKKSNITLSPRLVEMIKPFVGRADEYVISRKPCTRKASHHGAYTGMNVTLWKKINAWYRSHGICDGSKASYLNRRQRITEAFDKDGFKGAMRIGMNTPKVEQKHYIGNIEYVAA